MQKKNLFYILLNFLTIVFFHPPVLSEEIPRGEFFADSIMVGEPVRFALSYHHHKKTELYFPDKSFNYFPFELISKEYFTTSTQGEISVDSAIYYLRTFEVKPSFHYSLPVSVITSTGDTISISSTKDIVFLKPLLLTSHEGVKLREVTKIYPLKVSINYPYYFLVSFIALVVFLLLLLVFRKPIMKRYKLYFIIQGYKSFIINFERLERDFTRKPELGVMEKALSLWKNYLTRLENTPINTYTTTEIISLFKNQELVEALQTIDRSIYRGQISPESSKSMNILKSFSNKRYQKVKRNIING